MKPVEFQGQSMLLAPPADNRRAKRPIGALPVRVWINQDMAGAVTMTSYWRPSREELAVLLAGGHVRLDILCVQHPPVMVSAEECTELP